MRALRLGAALALLLPLSPGALAGQDRGGPGIDDFITLPIVSDPQVSPDGNLVAYTLATPSFEENRASSRVWVADLATAGSTQVPAPAGNDRAPRWSPDGRWLAFISTRDGGAQIWRMPTRGGEPVKVTNGSDGIADYLWAPDGKALYFWTDVPWGDSSEAARRAAPWPTEARIFTELFYRHWNEWRLGVRSHLFRVELADGTTTDVTPFDRDVPPLALGGRDIAFSPVGTELAVVYNPDSALATSTNNDIFVMGPDGSARQAITSSKGNDHSPQYSPDGRYVAYLAMPTPGFEADRQQLMLFDRASGRRFSVTPRWELSVSAFQWLPDARGVLAEVEERGGQAIYRIEVPTGRTTRLVRGGTNTALQVASAAEVMVFLRSTARRAPEVWAATLDGKNARPVTRVNEERFGGWDIPALEEFGFLSARNDSVFGWIMKPPGFAPGRRYPLLYLIHGGPQGAWLDQWHGRWNYATFAARGYVVAAVNFHGSTGYGQNFTNSISRNWGGLPYDDLMRGLDILARLPYVDSTRMGAAGASYGGYMVYWMAGHTSRFRALVAHDGIFNPLSMAGTTEELWFPTWEFGGTPADPSARAIMEKWSPANFVANWRTPMLVVHSQHDYRVDVSEGLQAFTALRLRGIPAKFLYFPDEDHFVTRPRNRRLWWSTVLDWFDHYLRQDT
ncbi:MAG: S9 family peptidase [Gemmatimonadota bacterium]|nr:S9 family peptidase [Gemmatimonadota bacterium]